MQNKIFQYKIQIESSLSLLHYYMSQELICTLTQTSQLFKINAEGLQCKKTRISQLHYITLVISILRLCCCCSCNRTRGATKGQRARHCFLLEKRKQLDLFSRAPSFFEASPLVDGHVRRIGRCASPVSLSRDAGRLTALMAVKISGKNVDS